MPNGEGSGIYEITQMLGNQDMLRQDLSQAMENVAAIFQGKYVDKIRATVNDHQIYAKKNPTKELQLINALKPFMDEVKQEKIDKVMDMLFMINAAKDMTGELKSIGQPQYAEQPMRQSADGKYTAASKIAHADGIYEYDENCSLGHDAGGYGSFLRSTEAGSNTNNLIGAILILALFMQNFSKPKF